MQPVHRLAFRDVPRAGLVTAATRFPLPQEEQARLRHIFTNLVWLRLVAIGSPDQLYRDMPAAGFASHEHVQQWLVSHDIAPLRLGGDKMVYSQRKSAVGFLNSETTFSGAPAVFAVWHAAATLQHGPIAWSRMRAILLSKQNKAGAVLKQVGPLVATAITCASCLMHVSLVMYLNIDMQLCLQSTSAGSACAACPRPPRLQQRAMPLTLARIADESASASTAFSMSISGCGLRMVYLAGSPL